MESKAANLFKGKNLVFIATVMKDGAPQLSPVWADYEDGFIMVLEWGAIAFSEATQHAPVSLQKERTPKLQSCNCVCCFINVTIIQP